MARRLDAGYLAGLVAEHRLREDEAAEVAEDLAHHLARRAFRVADRLTPTGEPNAAPPGQRAPARPSGSTGMWSFVADPDGVGRREGWWRGAAAGARPMPVPGRATTTCSSRPPLHEPRRRRLVPARGRRPPGLGRPPRSCCASTPPPTGPPCGSATSRWASTRAATRPSRPTSPRLAVARATALRVTVVVNNELTWKSIPPGVINERPDGAGASSSYFQDFFNYAGLIRSVWLSATSPTHLDDVTVTTDLDGADGLVRWSTVVADRATATCGSRSATPTGRRWPRATGTEGELRVPGVHRCGSPARLPLRPPGRPGRRRARWSTATSLPVGIRTVRVDGTRFLINGEPFYFQGFGMHEDLNVRGRGHDDVAMVHDFELLAWLGANSFRTSHYPYAEEVLDHADRLGFVVIDETAAVGLNLGVGGGLFGDEPRTTFSDETIGPAAQARAPAGHRGARRPGQEPPVGRALEPRQRARVPHRGVPGLLRAAVRSGPGGRPVAAGRLRQHDAGAARRLPASPSWPTS